MKPTYIEAAAHVGSILFELEDELSLMDHQSTFTLRSLTYLMNRWLASEEAVIAAAVGLVELGVLTESQSGAFRLDRIRLEETRAYRIGVRDAVSTIGKPTGVGAELCVGLPPTMDQQLVKLIKNEALDLRGCLVDLVSSAKQELVLASPFWDAATVRELSVILSRRVLAGVSVKLLGRFTESETGLLHRYLSRLVRTGRCQVLRWYKPDNQDPFGFETFHFKAIVSDRGKRGYLGTANFTTADRKSTRLNSSHYS